MTPLPPWMDRSGPMTEMLRRGPGGHGLGQIPLHLKPDRLAASVCGFCATGCNLHLHLNAQGEAINLTPDPLYPVNLGMACPKGWEALAPLAGADRATTPLLDGQPTSWQAAIRAMCSRFQQIQERHGRESLAFLGTGQIPIEELAFFGSLCKFGMGMRHGDGNTRQCMATAVTAYKQSFGFDAPPFTYADFEAGDVLVFWGANPAIAHPILWQRVQNNPHHPEIIVIDPRRTETAHAATQHLAIQPKSDLLLAYCLAHRLIELGAINETYINQHTQGWEAYAQFLTAYPVSDHLGDIGIDEASFERCAMAIARGRAVSMWWTMGVNQSHQATRTAQAIINLCLMTGHMGRPGTGANSITGQCNAMGSRLFSNTTNLLGGHDFENATHRRKIADVLDIPLNCITDSHGDAYDQIIEGIHKDRIKGFWIVATNGAHSWIQQDRFRQAMQRLDCLVVQDMYHSTETAQHAHIMLPAAGWGEKEGVFINAERRLGVIRKVRRAPGLALADFQIFRLVAEYWGCGEWFQRWTHPEAAFHLLTELSRNQPCDISGIESYEMLERFGGIQWPFRLEDLLAWKDGVREIAAYQERRLFEDGRFFTPDQRARFHYDAPRPMPEPTDERYPLLLITGRGSSAQWHTETRTRHSAILRQMHPSELLLDMHPQDAQSRGLQDHDLVEVSTRRASLTARLRVSGIIQPGHIFLPMHDARVNRLTLEAVDPHSRQPAYKACAAQVLAL